MTGFPKEINIMNPEATEGQIAQWDFPHVAFPPEHGFVAGAGGVYYGRFVWQDPDNFRKVKNAGTGKPLGIVPKNFGTYITGYKEGATLLILENMAVPVYTHTNVYVKALRANVVRGQKAFAKLDDGTVQFGNAGATIAGHVETDFTAVDSKAENEFCPIARI